MPALDAAGITTRNPKVYDYTRIGTAIGTATILNKPGLLHGIHIGNRVASGSIVLYDSIGTSGTIIDTILLGTQVFSDPISGYIYDIRTKNGLTAVNSANLGAVVTWNS
jgi:hypothetical protein